MGGSMHRTMKTMKMRMRMNKKTNRYTTSRAFRDLGKIDVLHESGKITKPQHDKRSKAVLKRLMKRRK